MADEIVIEKTADEIAIIAAIKAMKSTSSFYILYHNMVIPLEPTYIMISKYETLNPVLEPILVDKNGNRVKIGYSDIGKISRIISNVNLISSTMNNLQTYEIPKEIYSDIHKQKVSYGAYRLLFNDKLLYIPIGILPLVKDGSLSMGVDKWDDIRTINKFIVSKPKNIIIEVYILSLDLI